MKKLSFKKIGLLLVALYICFTFVNQQRIMFRQHKDINNYTSELQATREKNQRLQDEIKLSQDSRYIEKLARERLGLIKEGESPVVDSK